MVYFAFTRPFTGRAALRHALFRLFMRMLRMLSLLGFIFAHFYLHAATARTVLFRLRELYRSHS